MKLVLDYERKEEVITLTLERRLSSRRGSVISLVAQVGQRSIPILTISNDGTIRPCYLYSREDSNALKNAGFPINNNTCSMDFVDIKDRPDPNTYPSQD
jgi:hypothetical protein